MAAVVTGVVVVLAVLTVGVVAVNRLDDGAAAPDAAAPAPSEPSTPAPAGDPTATTARAPADEARVRADELLRTSGTLVSASADGVLLVDRDGEVHPLPGLSGPVDRAFPVGAGGVVFQRDDRAIRLVRGGDVTTLVALDDFGPSEGGMLPGESVLLDASRLVLHDVAAAQHRMVWSVEHLGESPEPAAHANVFQGDPAGGAPVQVTVAWLWESGAAFALGGDLRAELRGSEAAGELTVVSAVGDHDGPGRVPGDTTFGQPAGDWFRGVQLDDDGTRVATSVVGADGTWTLRVQRTERDEVVLEQAVPAGFVPVDLAAEVVVVSDDTASLVLDVATGEEVTRVPGRAVLVR